jgi:hypothetical protein
MEPKHVEQCPPPAYPTRREILVGAASFALVCLTGCGSGGAEEVFVAPIFPHGEGRGATGCVMITPPVFLSEEEGMQILHEELVKHGIQLEAGATLKGVRTPTDGADSNKRIAVEFVSQEDYFDLGGTRSRSSVQDYEFKEVAEEVAAAAKRRASERAFLGVFYDPSAKIPRDEYLKETENVENADWVALQKKWIDRGKEESGKLLRQQAQDFAAWLKEQKAIQ